MIKEYKDYKPFSSDKAKVIVSIKNKKTKIAIILCSIGD